MKRGQLVKVKPPIILVVLLLVAAALHFFTALRDVFDVQNMILGGILLGMGIGLIRWAHGFLTKAGTTIIPAEKPTQFVATGPYQFSRNPMYVAGALITLGIAFFVGTLPFFLAWVSMFFILNFIHIPYEEENLEQIFGDAYRNYKKRVRRWL